MATPEALLFKINGTQQATQVAALEGKTFAVGKVSAAGKTGLSKWLFLNPTSTAAGSKASSVALKIEGTRQISQLSGLAGKTVTIGKSPATIGGTSKFLLLNTGKGAAAATAAATGTATGAAVAKGKLTTEMILVKAEGGRQAVDMTTLAGKTFTVMKPPMMGGVKASNWVFLKPATGAGAAGEKIVAFKVQAGTGTSSLSSLAGKSFTVSKAPLAAGAGGNQWLAFKPVAGLASKGAAATSTVAAAKSKAAATAPAAVKAPAAAMNGTKAGVMAKSSTATQAATAAGKGGSASLAGKAAAAQTAKTVGGGTIWKGTGLSLGLGLGLGGWGPLLLIGAAAFGVGVYGYMKNSKNLEEESDEIGELSLEG